MFEKAKAIIKDVCMKFYNETKPLYIERDASGVGLRVVLLQQEVIQTVTETKHQTIVPLDPLHFPAKASPEQKKYTAISKRSTCHTIWP